MNIIIEDNFFDDPDKIRQIGLSQEYKVRNRINTKTKGWEGYRARIYKECVDQRLIADDEETIKDSAYKGFIESCRNYTLKAFNDTSDVIRFDVYFNVTNENTGSMIKDWIHVKHHTDIGVDYAGLVYLTPNAPKKSGTSIVDFVNEKIIHVENVYNRLICYPAYYTHGVDSCFGNDIETGRMTLTFFIQTSLEI